MYLVGHEIATLGAHQAHVNMAIRMAEKSHSEMKKSRNSGDETSEFIDYLEETLEDKVESKLSPRERMALKFPENDFWK